MILIKVNNNNYQFSKIISIQELIQELEIQGNGIAIAVNNTVIQKESWVTQKLHNNDDVLIIKSTQGG